MKKLVLFPLVVTFLIVAILGGSHTVAAPAQATLEGTVTVNGDPAPADVGLVAALEDDTECGRALTGAGGTFTMSLITKCVGKPVFFRLAATEDQATTSAVIKAGAQTVDIAFEGLSDESLRAIGALPAIEVEAEQAVEKALEEAAEEVGAPVALITGTNLFWLVLAVSIGGMVLLLCMVGAKLCQPHLPLLLSWCKKRARRDEKSATPDAQEQTAADDKNEPSAEERKAQEQTAADDKEEREAQELTYRRQIEGMVLILVIVAIIILGITEKVSDEGLISVLAAIVGYCAGRATAGG